MPNVFENYQASLAETMARLAEIQAQLNIATSELQTDIDRNRERLVECKKDAPLLEVWANKLMRRKTDG